jgi:3-phenylpropionate/cinnamic acid dioxygenase small subunit
VTVTDPPTVTRTRVLPRDPTYFELVTFLDDEAALLDAGEIMAWFELLAEDIVYRIPVRQTRERNESQFSDAMFHIDDNRAALAIKLQRLALIPSAWAENPPSGSRRFVTGIRAWEGDADGEYVIASSVLLVRSRFDDPESRLLSGRRSDVVRRTGDSFLLARRTVYLDQATLPTHNLAIYL